MPKQINFAQVEESTGNYEEIEAGIYQLTIQSVVDEPDKERMWLVFDIASGEHKAFYGRDSFYENREYAHRLMMSYKDTALGMLKRRLHILSDCNPGFDAMAAFNGNINLFVGKMLFVGVGLEENRSDNGKMYSRPDWFHAKWGTAQDVNEGKLKVPDFKPLVDEGAGKVDSQSSAAADAYDDVPFM